MTEFVFVEKKPMDGREHTVNADVTIGREGCDIVLPDAEVSRRHAMLRITASGPAVEDLGSSNGTFVNGERIRGPRQLADGDHVRFGNTEWQLRTAATANLGAAQVTAARAIPADRPPAAAPPAAPPQAPPSAAPETGTPPLGRPGTSERRGDVPPPPEVTPSAIRRTLPSSAAAAPPAFTPVATRHTKGSAATRAGYTAFCFAVFVATLVALAVYFIVN